MTVDWAVASCALPGEIECGDRSTVVRIPDGVVIAVADGLGHGPEAAEAADMAMATIEANSGATVQELLRLCHERLRRTRGVALSIAVLDIPHHKITWSGVGNVEGLLLRATGGQGPEREAILLRGGIVGYQLPPPHVASRTIAPWDVVIFATDGIQSPFIENLTLHESPQWIADAILRDHFRGTDDALVLVARLEEDES